MDHSTEAPHAYADMLMRRNPQMAALLQSGEYPIAFSRRKPDYLFGVCMCFIGIFAAADTLVHPNTFGNVFYVLAVMLAGAVCVWFGIRALYLTKNTYIAVTDRRIIIQNIDLLGRPRKAESIPRSEIKRARLLKSTVMYRIRREDGAVSFTLQSGRTVVVSGVQDGEGILSALR